MRHQLILILTFDSSHLCWIHDSVFNLLTTQKSPLMIEMSVSVGLVVLPFYSKSQNFGFNPLCINYRVISILIALSRNLWYKSSCKNRNNIRSGSDGVQEKSIILHNVFSSTFKLIKWFFSICLVIYFILIVHNLLMLSAFFVIECCLAMISNRKCSNKYRDHISI